MEGRPGSFLAPLAISYSLAVVIAMVVALTLTPALSYLLPARSGVSPLVTRLGAAYDGMLSKAVGASGAVLGAAAVAGLAAVVALIALNPTDPKLIPDLKDRGVIVRLDAEPGAASAVMTQAATELSKQLRGVDGVENVGAAIGRAVQADRIVDVNSGEVIVALESDADFDKTFAAIEDVAGKVQGVETRGRHGLRAADPRGRCRQRGREPRHRRRARRPHGRRQAAGRTRLRAEPGDAEDRGQEDPRHRRRDRRREERARSSRSPSRSSSRSRSTSRRPVSSASSRATSAATRRSWCRASWSAPRSRTRRSST